MTLKKIISEIEELFPTLVFISLVPFAQDEAVEAEKMEQEESEKMVLALNEENAKVSAAALQEDSQAATEDAAEDLAKMPPPLVKQLSYKPGKPQRSLQVH